MSMGNYARQIGSLLLVTFVAWYLLRQTTLGRSYTEDMLAIPLGAGEGLQSAALHFKQ